MSKIAKTTNLIIRLDGAEINNGIDVFELAPALLSIGNIVKEANIEAFPVSKEIGVNVKPFEEGSFIVEIALFAHNNLQQLIDLANSNDAQQIKQLLEWLGLIGIPTGGMGLVQLIKWLKGKPKKVEKVSPNEIKFTNNEDNSVTVNINVGRLYSNSTIHEHFYQGYGKILENDGIDTFESYLKEEPDNKESSSKDDLPAFKAYSEGSPDVEVEESSESEYETHLNFKRGSYEGKKDNWSFRRGDQSITATILDQKFLKQVESGEIRPYSKDLLKVILIEKRRIKGTEILNPTYEIREVLDYRPARPAPTLFDD